ncbi:MAG: hypothetical protein A3H98_00670 [Bacteroidetes bacterium RIFCSPLOWO2_02_FULL_36_8]|nr:MAG: hypothetical protein A3H98_00670 [Bacteroidetes bacterium RIFCSPLOWO2_02_FULL_36_8]OFY68736.1 MAG: hypothetical protein A3G23_02780 [Bacteroidetes bacterium RIFCSPLOWO2_12_FULL_37_12]
MELYYSTEINPDTILLSGEEAKHCVKSLRHNAGDIISVGDGRGSIYECKIIEIKTNSVNLQIINKKIFSERKRPELHIAISPLKNPGRLEWFVEKATEMGVDVVTFLNCQRTEKRHVNRERIRNIIISAGKQSCQTWFTECENQEDFFKFIDGIHSGIKLIANANQEPPLFTNLVNKMTQSVTVLIGPEGDFTNSEVESAVKKGFIQVSLGQNRLRTETAGVLVAGYFSVMKS